MGCSASDTAVSVRGNKKLKKIQQGAEDGALLQNITRTDRIMNSRDIKLTNQTLKNHHYFFNLSAHQIEEIQKKMFYCTAQKNKFIFKKGDTASCYLIIEIGQVVIEQFNKVLKKGDSFGELALLYNATRSASVRATANAGFWCLSRSEFKQALQEVVQRNYSVSRPYIDKVKIFQFLTQNEKDAIAHSMKVFKYQAGEFIFKQGDPATTYAIVKEGKISIEIDKKQINKIKQGDSFGEQAFYETSKRSASAIAIDKVIILSIHKDEVQKVLGAEILKVGRYNIHRWALSKSPVFSQLTPVQADKLVSEIFIVSMKKGDVICQAGKKCNALYFSTENSFQNKAQKVVVERGLLFGDKFVLNDTVVEETLFTSGAGVVGKVTMQVLQKLFGKPIDQLLNDNKNLGQVKYTTEKKPAKKSGYESYILDNFNVIKKLGEGQFGKVFLVKYQQNPTLFALKCIQKQQIVENKMEKITLEEKQICEVVDFPFIMSYCRSFKDDFFVYLLLEHIRGAELFDVLREIGLVKLPLAKFYIASVILGIQYLHSKNIIYRDLKPENLMVESNGYIRLIDLGTAKKLLPAKGFRTYTMIGTPHYMGPEVLQGKGYTFSCDLWSIGVLMYEFLCGELPYAESLQDPYQIYYQVMKNPLRFPSTLTDAKAKKLIQQLINKTPQNRLGRSYAALKNNPFFDDINWDNLFQKKMEPPYRSELCKKEDESTKKQVEGKPFLQQIQKEKKGLKKVPMAKWDSQF